MNALLAIDAGKAVLQVFLLLVGFVLLVKGADFFVDGASGIAKKLKISSFIIGVTVVALGTSAPELSVTIVDAIKPEGGDLIMGNILGSNVMNILLILGISALVCKLPTEKSTRFIDLPFLIFTSVLFIVFGAAGYSFGTTAEGETYLAGSMTWWNGLILVVLYIAFMVYNVIAAKRQSKARLEQAVATTFVEEETVAADAVPEKFFAKIKYHYERLQAKTWFLIIISIAGLGMVVGGAELVVNSATYIAQDMIGIPSEIVALTVVAFGTSLPELITSVSAAKKGDVGIATGNIIGSNIANILLIGGVGALCSGSRGIPFTMEGLIGGVVSLFAAVLIFGFSSGKTKTLGKVAGSVMLVCLVLYYGVIFLNLYVFHWYFPGVYVPVT